MDPNGGSDIKWYFLFSFKSYIIESSNPTQIAQKIKELEAPDKWFAIKMPKIVCQRDTYGSTGENNTKNFMRKTKVNL